MNLEIQTKRRKDSKKLNKRFYTQLDMAIIKKDIALCNSRIKRGLDKDYPNNIIVVCGCGREGCFIHKGFHNNL